MSILRKYWFLIGLALAILLGHAWPEGGAALRRTPGAMSFCIATILFLSGLLLELRELARQALNLRALSLALGITYVLGPLLGLGLARALSPGEGPLGIQFTEAVLLAATQASTLASSIALTRLAGGSSELALLVTILSNVSTAVLTPILLRLGLGVEVSFSTLDMMGRIAAVILLPVLLGQIVRRWMRALGRTPSSALRPVPQAIILIFAFVGFSSASPRFEEAGDLVARFLLAAAGLHLGLSIASYAGARVLRLESSERIAVFYTASQKTVPNGIYLWEHYFASNPVGAVPLVFVQVIQLTLGYLLVPAWRRKSGSGP